jgi:hypothetical protein
MQAAHAHFVKVRPDLDFKIGDRFRHARRSAAVQKERVSSTICRTSRIIGVWKLTHAGASYWKLKCFVEFGRLRIAPGNDLQFFFDNRFGNLGVRLRSQVRLVSFAQPFAKFDILPQSVLRFF